MQIVSFVVISMQFAKLEDSTSSELVKTRKDMTQYADKLMQRYDAAYQSNFNEITSALDKQEANMKQEIKLLRSEKQDFSGVIEEAVESVVTVVTESSMGTGFFISTDGYFVTNYHVIVGQENVTKIRTYDKDTLDATFIGKDEKRDLALLKVSGNFRAMQFANSDNLQVGRKVVAIGNPLGLSFTVTEGIISGLHREGPSNHPEYVQTDVSLNPGNSGGPLIDTEGKVVGINNFKIGGAENLGFALESNAIKKSINEIANKTLVN